jgi:amino acid transporter
MKPYAFLALVVAVTGFIAIVTAIEAPRKPKRDGTIHVLPRVEEMPTNPTPFSF